MDRNSVNPIEFYNLNVTLIGELDHPDEKKEYINGSYKENFETKTYSVKFYLKFMKFIQIKVIFELHFFANVTILEF